MSQMSPMGMRATMVMRLPMNKSQERLINFVPPVARGVTLAKMAGVLPMISS